MSLHDLLEGSLGSEPRLHGNGFIQLDLGDDQRLHIWSPDLPPAQRVSTQIHDHQFFDSLPGLRRLARKVVIDGQPLSKVEEEERASKVAEYYAAAKVCDLTLREATTILLRDLQGEL